MIKQLLLITLFSIVISHNNQRILQENNLNSIDPTVIPGKVEIVPTIQPVITQPLVHNVGNNPAAIEIHTQQQLNTQNQQKNQTQKAPQPQINPQTLRLWGQRLARIQEQEKHKAQLQHQERVRQQQQNYRKLQLQGQLSQTQMKKHEQNSKYKIQQSKVQQGTRFTQHIFQQYDGLSQFIIQVSMNQTLAIKLFLYVSQDNTFVRTRNIHQESPIQLYIYEDDQVVIHQGEFYFDHYVVLNGKQGAHYRLRFFNHGSNKLISMNINKLIKKGDISDKLTKENNQHAIKTQNLAYEIHNWFGEFRKLNMLDFHDLKVTQGYIQKYYGWQIFETILCIIMSAFQINFIQKMLKGNSVI